MKLTTTGLPDDCAALSKVVATLADGGLDTRTITPVCGSRASRSSACSAVMPPTSAFEIATARAERLRDALTQLVNGAGDGLQARARRGDDADPAAANPVGKAQPNAVDDRRAAVRAHDQQALVARLALERDLVRQVDVVAVEEDVLAQVQRLLRHAGGVAAGDRDQDPVGVGQGRCGRPQAARPIRVR